MPLIPRHFGFLLVVWSRTTDPIHHAHKINSSGYPRVDLSTSFQILTTKMKTTSVLTTLTFAIAIIVALVTKNVHSLDFVDSSQKDSLISHTVVAQEEKFKSFLRKSGRLLLCLGDGQEMSCDYYSTNAGVCTNCCTMQCWQMTIGQEGQTCYCGPMPARDTCLQTGKSVEIGKPQDCCKMSYHCVATPSSNMTCTCD